MAWARRSLHVCTPGWTVKGEEGRRVWIQSSDCRQGARVSETSVGEGGRRRRMSGERRGFSVSETSRGVDFASLTLSNSSISLRFCAIFSLIDCQCEVRKYPRGSAPHLTHARAHQHMRYAPCMHARAQRAGRPAPACALAHARPTMPCIPLVIYRI